MKLGPADSKGSRRLVEPLSHAENREKRPQRAGCTKQNDLHSSSDPVADRQPFREWSTKELNDAPTSARASDGVHGDRALGHRHADHGPATPLDNGAPPRRDAAAKAQVCKAAACSGVVLSEYRFAMDARCCRYVTNDLPRSLASLGHTADRKPA